MFQRLRIARTRQLVLPVTFGVFACALAAIGSWIPSLWGDEAASLMSAERPISSLLTMLRHVDAVHGTYYLGLHAWIQIAGTSPFAIRFPSAVAVGLCTAAVVILARRLSTTATAVIAGLVCAVLPRMTYAGEEARSYAFSAAIAAWLTVIFVELLRRKQHRPWLWIAYGATLTLGFYLFLYVGLIALAHAVILVWMRPARSFTGRWLITVGLAAIAAVPILAMAFVERSQVAYLARTAEVTFNSVFVSLWFGTSQFAALAWLLLIAVGCVSAADWALRRRRSRAFAQQSGNIRPAPSRTVSLELVAGAWLIVPSAVLIGSSPILSDFTARYLTFAAPAAAILIACAIVRIARIARTRARLGILILLVAAVVATAVPVYSAQRGPYSKNNSDWAQLSATVGAHARPGDAVAFDESTRPSRRPRLAMRTYPAGFAGLADPTLRTPFAESASWRDVSYTVKQAFALGRFDGVQRVWLVEYATRSRVDSFGISDLESRGFSIAKRYRDYRSEVILLTRSGTDA
jgi:mannosyltransferase